jgi:hypothetical protein
MLVAAMVMSPFDFKGVKLGTTISEFRAQPTPAQRYGPRSIICTGDPGFREAMNPPTQEVEVGVKRCAVVETIGGIAVPTDADLTPQDHATVRYFFFNDRLFRIEVYPMLYSRSVVENALTTKYGKPAAEMGHAQTQIGAVFLQETLTWTRGTQAIMLRAPAETTRLMSVLYLDTETAKRVEAAIKARHNPADAM